MKRLYLNLAFLYLGILSSYAQVATPIPTAVDSSGTAYHSKKLTLDEVNFVSAYYHQNGNHSAVTGGTGTELLSDFANNIDVQLSNYNKRGQKNTFLFELGIDHYSSASSDKIDPSTISSASKSDNRIYPSLNWTRTNEHTGNAYGFTGSYSQEYDYQSLGAAFNLTRLSKSKNTQFDLRLQTFLDTWKVILPVELRSAAYQGKASDSGPAQGESVPRNSFSAAFSLSQVISTRLQALFVLEPAYQHGLLSTRYQRDYFTDGTLRAENLPGKRYKLPIAVRFNYFLDDHYIIRTYYRYYMDNWGIRAHTAELEVPVKLTSFASVSPYYRYSTQQGSRYFAPYGQHDPDVSYYTSDYDLADLHSSFFGAGFRVTPPKGVLGWQHLNMLELRYGHYVRSTGLSSNIVTMNLRFK